MNVADVVASVVAFLRTEIERAAKLETVISATPVVLMDRSALARVLTNLLLNAAQAMAEKPGGVVTVEVAEIEKTAILRVRDDGRGIAPESVNRIFDPYFTTRPDGSGLGLSIVRDLVEQAGGQAAVVSAPGRGATFEVHFPLAQPETSDGG